MRKEGRFGRVFRGAFVISSIAVALIAGSIVAQTAAPRGQAPAAGARGQVAAPARGQTAPAGVPRLPGGKPNFSGMWQALGTAEWDIEDHGPSAGPFYQLGAIGATPPGVGIVEGGPLPYRPEALAKKKENYSRRYQLDPVVKCYMPGVPRANYMPFPFQIVQSTNTIVFAYEFATANRTVRMTNHQPAPVPTWMGWSNGRWEGDTLVIDVTGLNGDTWFDRAGNHHSDKLHVIERYSYRSRDVINYEATIEDPETFTRPWKMSFPLYRRLERNAQILEFKCVEYAEELLYGDLRKK
jgi:hypothetical protein